MERNEQKDDVFTLGKHGLQYKILRKGKGRYYPNMKDKCIIILEERHMDGRKVQYTYHGRDEREPIRVSPEQRNPGLKMALGAMVEGDHWEIYVPANLNFGLRGSRIDPVVEPGEALIYRVRLVEIEHHLNKEEPLRPALRCRIHDETSQDQCDERELKYIKKLKDMILDHSDLELKSFIESEMKRFRSLRNSSINNKSLEWIQRRSSILLQVKHHHHQMMASSDDDNNEDKSRQEFGNDVEEQPWGDVIDLDDENEL